MPDIVSSFDVLPRNQPGALFSSKEEDGEREEAEEGEEEVGVKIILTSTHVMGFERSEGKRNFKRFRDSFSPCTRVGSHSNDRHERQLQNVKVLHTR